MNVESEPISVAILENWASDPDAAVALRLRQRLRPVEESRIIFPPTYADIGYNIDQLSDGTQVATIDSIGSQANRLEPIFKSDSTNPDNWLVPQIQILLREEACGQCDQCNRGTAERCANPRPVLRSLLDLAHRAADAVIQCCPDLQGRVEAAFLNLRNGDAGPLCTIAPTSLVFGVWDSRGVSGEKRPRLIRSIIRAWEVEPIHAAAQFNSVSKYLDSRQSNELKKTAKDLKVQLSEVGLDDAPSGRVHGGVLVHGEITRDVTVNLIALRGICGTDEEETKAIRRYLLGLCLFAAVSDGELYLREGCLLHYAGNSDEWFEVPRRGEPRPVRLDRDVVRNFVEEAAHHFRQRWPMTFAPQWPKLVYRFDVEAAKKLLEQKAKEKKSGT
ncbi:MAG: type I-U CRISPR-associated RAMP protein Csb1/Cas7u [Phycisphaerales bacterium]|nr:type I-U CRISPR-associated RAMP protein Csb1/Cas7u [Phycisphaerales bacterium]